MAHDGIAAVVDLAIGTARRRASKGDVALGLIAALRRIRAALDEESPARAGQLDATVRDIVIAHNLGRREIPASVALPEPGPGAALAITVLDDTAETCLALNAHTPDGSALQAAICLIAHRLLLELGGTPDIRRLYDRLWAARDEAAEPEPAAAVSLH